MPYDVSTFTLPCGSPGIRADGSGVISKEDADYLMTFIGPKGSMYMVPLLVLAHRIKSFSSEARNLFVTGFGPGVDTPWCAVVAPNPLVRVTSNFIMRVSGTRKAKMIGTEADAIRWLDERTREDAAKSKAT